MKNKKKTLLVALCTLLSASAAVAQADVTALYLENAGFDTHYDYDINATGNVAQEMLPVVGWTNDYTMNYTIVGVYQVGTQKTFNGASVPATNVDGTAEGGVLALSTGWQESLKLYQEVTLPQGKYALVTAYYNGCDATASSSLFGWIPASGASAMSKVSKFTARAWTVDTLVFEVTAAQQKGKVQIGMKAAANGSANSAKLSVDYVKLLSYDWDNSGLVEAIAEATALYGEGTGNGAEALKAVIDAANALLADENATTAALIEAMQALDEAMEAYHLANADADDPIDMTSLILNPSFENGFTEWTNASMQTQTNSTFTYKAGNTYVEKWVSQGNKAGDAHVRQTIAELANGRYMLKVAAQNIQQNSSAAQTGVWIVANDNRLPVTASGEYELEFTLIEKQLTVGFEAVGATGNYLACDNFRLYFMGNDMAVLQAELKRRADEAEALAAQMMNAGVLAALQEAVAAARAELEKEGDEGYPAVAAALKAAVNAAEESAEAYATLQAAIDDAAALLGTGDQTGAEALQAAIDAAKEVMANTAATPAELQAMVDALDNAAFALRLANGSGTAPKVKTHDYVARGATMAFGRSTVSGVAAADLLEQGFCWGTSPEPTVLDNRTTAYYNQNGRIYHMTSLEPSTIYYVRAYALTKTYAVGYGDVVKVITLPKGQITWSYNNGGSAEENARINAAVADAVYYLNNLTSIKGFHTTVNYGAQTPTADCSYGGWMRVGPNASYQRTGTIMHELGHGIGVGTHEIWYGGSSPLRAGSGRGDWLGDRATAVVRFLDNSTTSVMTGDGTHMWPYGVNGAHEDTGSPMLYMSNALIHQALGEDGLPPTGGFCTPAYVFDQEDTVKYYLKSESEGYGMYTSYLVEDEKGHLAWKTLTVEETLGNDSAAWYITFNPTNSYYQLRNAATGHYMSYAGTGSNGIRTAAKSSATTNENFHLMRSRIDVSLGSGDAGMDLRGYWIIHPEHKLNPTTLVAAAKGGVSTAAFNLTDAASAQRWFMLTAEEVADFDKAAIEGFMGQLDDAIEHIKGMVAVPHTEDVEGTDAAVNAVVAELEAKREQSLTTGDVAALLEQADEALFAFLANATPADVEQPFDLTYMIENAAIDDASGWSVAPAFNHSCLEFYQATFDFNQTIQNLPAGTYQLCMQGFQRPGSSADSYSAYIAGRNQVTTVLYANSKTKKIQHIATEAQSRKLGGSESSVGSPTKYMPNDMQAASIYFGKGLYENALITELKTDKASMKIGLRCNSSQDYYWTIFDNFRLYYYGSMSEDVVSSIELPSVPAVSAPVDVYSITGVRVRTATTSLDGLPSGIYIVGGRKVLVK